MTLNYKIYLAEKVLSDQEHVTYRDLSRALNVHCNHAKRMLYEFHRHENSKKPKSVNATYLITGVLEKLAGGPIRKRLGDGDDEIMQSSPFVSSQLVPEDESSDEEIPVTSILLVKEEELDDARRKFKAVYSIFVYSVQPTSPPDLNILADIMDIVSSQDPLQYGPMYGMIQNKNVKRRTGSAPAPVAASNSDKPKVQKQRSVKEEEKPNALAQEIKTEAKGDSEPRPASRQSAESQTSRKDTKRPTSAKRSGSDLFKAFAKTKPPAKKKKEPANASGAESGEPSGVEDVIMDDDSEEEREDLFLDTGERSNSNKDRETRKEREDKLKKMMEDDDEMPDAPEVALEAPPSVTEEATEMEKLNTEISEPTSATAPVRNSTARRRGRRRVMKKKMFRDADGYLVTKEEPMWESFSEEEPEPPKKKPPLVSTAAKPGKGGQRPNQGNIMSFFGKK
ncbi:CDC27 protein [Emydomyces testavorans]|uniref:DNA polymerase delta subunit 3 n=1 Tax=Emydomyces testavorans TaxID=2070801 RepID=A0AAF0IL12_9EURO|nr:CDC27 protein [Emydomyces testavorans]